MSERVFESCECDRLLVLDDSVKLARRLIGGVGHSKEAVEPDVKSTVPAAAASCPRLRWACFHAKAANVGLGAAHASATASNAASSSRSSCREMALRASGRSRMMR